MTLIACRICLEKNKEYIKVVGEGSQSDVKAIVEQHFWFQIEENDGGSKQICMICWQTIESFHKFYTHISNIHKSSNQNTSLETHIVQLENEVDSGGPDVKTETNDVCKLSIDSNLVDYVETNSNDSSSDDNDTPDFGFDESEFESNEEDDSEEEVERNRKRKQSPRKKKILEEDSKLNDKDEQNKIKPKRKRNCRTPYSKRIKKTSEEILEEIKAKTLQSVQLQTENQLIRQYFTMECQLCSVKFEDYAFVRVHYREAHKQRGYLMCCLKKMWSRNQVLQHIQLHIDPDAFKCEICGRKHSNKQGVEHHMMLVHSKKAPSFKCEFCAKLYYTHHRLENHKKTHGEKLFICKDCGKRFHTNSLLNSHTRTKHEVTNLHICDICAKSFKTKGNFTSHMKYVHAETPQEKVQCQLCGNWLNNEAALRRHMKKHKDQETNPMTCNVCSKVLPHKYALRNHMRLVHTLERAFACEICNKAFKRAYTLREHMTTHTGEVLYNCQFCPKTFNSSANMYAHKNKIHPVEWAEEKNKKKGS